jgi:membrane protein YqaA with SNARE-associated domain
MRSLLGYFLTPSGLVILGLLDSSLIFFLPLGIDFAVIIVSARRPEMFWANALLATAGSTIGAAGTFWIGRKVGKHGLSRLIQPARLERIENRLKPLRQSAAISVGALAMVPPPFPFTAFVLTSGALGANAPSLLLTLATVRLLRFGVEGWLASRYGARILTWMKSTGFEVIIGLLIAVAIIGTVASAVTVARGVHRRK